MNFPISFRISSTAKLSKYVTFSTFTYKAIQSVPIYSYSSRFFRYATYFVLDKLFLEQTSLKLDSFSLCFLFQNELKGWDGIKSFHLF